jgi:hypothetical protein
MPKGKKCSKCGLDYHNCHSEELGYKCSCFKFDCCLCPISEIKEENLITKLKVSCPCDKEICQKEWKHLSIKLGLLETESEDSDSSEPNAVKTRGLFHCKCHFIAARYVGKHCYECDNIFCKKCLRKDNRGQFVDGIESDEELELENDKSYCRQCIIQHIEDCVKLERKRLENANNQVFSFEQALLKLREH